MELHYYCHGFAGDIAVCRSGWHRKGRKSGGAGFYCTIWSIAAGEPLQKAQKKPCRAVFQLSGLACTQHLPQHQADVERADVDQQTLQNVLMSAQGAAPHSARFVAVGKAALDFLAGLMRFWF